LAFETVTMECWRLIIDAMKLKPGINPALQHTNAEFVCTRTQWDQSSVLFFAFLIAFLMRDFFSSGVRAFQLLRICFVASLRLGSPFGSSEEGCSITIIFYSFPYFFWKGKLRLDS